VKEALDLRSVQIHRNNVVDTDNLQKIGHHPGNDRLPPAIPLIRPAVAEEGYDRRDTGGAGAAASVRESEQLDQVIVDRGRSRLHEENLLATHGVEKLHRNVAVRISIHHTGAYPGAKLARDRCGQYRVGRAGENRELIVHTRLGPNRIRTTSSPHCNRLGRSASAINQQYANSAADALTGVNFLTSRR
jgi:hypothetical protein